MRERWLAAAGFAELAGISGQKARRALSRAVEGYTWRGATLKVRTVHGRGGRSGLSYEVSLKSLSAALPETADAAAPPRLPFRPTVLGERPQTAKRWAMIEPIVMETEAGTPERAAAVKAAVAAGKGAERTLRRLIAQYEGHGWAGCAHKLPTNAGERRIMISREFDRAFLAAGHAEATLREIAAEMEQLRRDIWASPARRAGLPDVRRRLLHELDKLCAKLGTPVLPAAMTISKRWVSEDRGFEEIDIWKHDAKRFHDNLPHITRDNLAGPPMTRVVADVKHLDVVLRRPDGSDVWPKVVGFMDRSTGRVFLHPIMLAPGEGVRQEHVIEGFLAMVEAWGFPEGLYLDNGSEFACFERIKDCIALANAEAGRPIIYAKRYNAKAKTIENWFKRLDQYLFSMFPGYAGGDRMNKKAAKVGRPTQPYPHSWERFCEDIPTLLVDFNARPIGGQWRGRSADDVYREKCAAGWRPILVDSLILDAAFSRRETRRLDRGGLKIKGVRHHHPSLDRARAGSMVEIAISWRRGADPLFRIVGEPHWAYAVADMPYHPQDAHGARESGRRARAHVSAVRKRAAGVRSYDPLATSRELAGRRAAPVLPFSADRLGGASELVDLAEGQGHAVNDRRERLTHAEIERRMQAAYEEDLAVLYG